jgi:hypothetical protein
VLELEKFIKKLRGKDIYLFLIKEATPKMVDPGIPSQYYQYIKVFLEREASTLPLDHAVHEI